MILYLLDLLKSIVTEMCIGDLANVISRMKNRDDIWDHLVSAKAEIQCAIQLIKEEING